MLAHRLDTPAPPDWQDDASVEQVRLAVAKRPVFRDRGGIIERVQTHISSVFLTPRYVFKFKRAVDAGFVDFRAVAARRHYCREELRLNRRLAPGVYLGVLALRRGRAGYTFGPSGAVVDYCVAMRRLRPEAMLDNRLRSGEVLPAEMDTLADFIARFHRRLRPARRFAAVGSLETWQLNWEENFAQTLPAVGVVLTAEEHAGLADAVRGYLARNAAALEARVKAGFVRNGHGDLRCEHIELGKAVRIIDCVEFTERFRYGDVANDVSFLLMDLCQFGYPGLARRLLARYAEAMGDLALERLVPFYACYRATVRGKVLAMRLSDRNLQPGVRAQVEHRARRFFMLARAFARQMRPPVVLALAGLMGSGKSRLARELSARTGLAVLASDAIRKELAAGGGMEPVRDRSPWGAGLYSARWTERTYGEMFARAGALLARGRSVILDASFSRPAQRDAAFALARQAGAEPWLIECRVPDEVALERLRRREAEGAALSDGRPELYPAQKAAFEPVAGLPAGRHLVADRTRPAEDNAAQVLAAPGLEIPAPLFTLPPEIPRRREDAGAPE